MRKSIRDIARVAAPLVVIGSLATACGGGEEADLPGNSCDQECRDGSVIFGIQLSVDARLYNDEVAGHALPRTGVACPGGGTVDISGTGTSVGTTQMLDLTFVMDSCRFAEPGYDLTLTGTLGYAGQFDNTTGETSLSYTSPGLGWTGAVGYGTPPQYPVDGEACVVSIQRDPSATGSLCGRAPTGARTPPAL